ncbi:MAG: hypothetical protein J6I56_08390 [Lachnospiraceae bacterium]|nr:hypothetical protein [Lachnospiraceae bacterium]
MKKFVVFCLSAVMFCITACAAPAPAVPAPAAAPESVAPAEAAAPEVVPETAAAVDENMILVRVNTDGLGEIAISETGDTPVFEEQFPVSSSFTHVEKGTVIALSARQQDDSRFVKWTRNGEYYSDEADITATIDEEVEFIAVFGMSSGFDGPAVSDVADAKTMADVLALPSYAYSTMDKYFVYTFELKGTMYRAIAELPDGFADQIFALDFSDPQYDEKHNALVAPLPISRLDCLTDMIPPQEELDALKGKTFGDLLDDGWSYGWYYNLEDKVVGMNSGLFSYSVGFDGTIEAGTEVDDETLRPLIVTSVTYDTLGNITADLEEE